MSQNDTNWKGKYPLFQDKNLFVRESRAAAVAEAEDRQLDPRIWACCGFKQAIFGFRCANIVISREIVGPIPENVVEQFRGRVAVNGMLIDERDGSYWTA